MTVRESLAWALVGVILAPVGVLLATEEAGYVICHRRVEQAAPLLVPSWDAVTLHCDARL